MKTLYVLLALSFLLTPSLQAGDQVVGTIQPNILRQGRYDVVTKSGETIYYLERDILNQERWLIRDPKTTKILGDISRNPLRPSKQDIKMYDNSKPVFKRFNRKPSTGSSYRFKRFNK